MNLQELRDDPRAAIPISDCSSVIGLDRRTVGRGIADGTIPSIRIGRRVLIPREPLLTMLTSIREAA